MNVRWFIFFFFHFFVLFSHSFLIFYAQVLETPSSSPSENNRLADVLQSPSMKSVNVKSSDEVSSPIVMSLAPAKSSLSEDELFDSSSPKERDNEKYPSLSLFCSVLVLQTH
jgi:hypothetical protein